MINCRKRIKEVVMAGVWLAVAASCRWGGTEYHRFQPIVEGEWGRNDTLLFELPALPSGDSVNLYVDVRYTRAFPYRYLDIVVGHNVEDSLHERTDTLRCMLYNDRGEPVGEGVAGLFVVETPCAVLLPDGGSAPRLWVKHDMAGVWQQGITDVGVRIEE